MNTHILVITKTYSTSLGIIRSLGAKGYHVELFYITGKKGMSKITSSSKYVMNVTEFIGRRDKAIIDEILDKYSKRKEKYFLFPTDDYTASLIDQNSDKLSKFFFMPYVEGHQQKEITRLMNKSVQNDLAQKCGFKTVEEWIVSLANDKIVIPKDLIYPCFVKPLFSAQGTKTEMGICRNQEELKQKLYVLQKNDRERVVLVQRYLNITQEYSMSGVCLNQEIILPAIVKKLKIAQHQKGVTLFGELVSIDEIASVKEALYKFLKEIHFVGMFDFEVMCVGDTIYFGEMNFRSGGPNYSYDCAGVNLPQILVEYVVNGTIPQNIEIKLNKKFLYEKAAWEDYQIGYMSKRELDTLYKKADYLLLENSDDKKPGKEFLRYIKLKVIKSELKKAVILPLKKKCGLN